MFYAQPGGHVLAKDVAWCKEHIPNLKTVDIGDGIHYLQEDNPHKIGEELSNWYQAL